MAIVTRENTLGWPGIVFKGSGALGCARDVMAWLQDSGLQPGQDYILAVYGQEVTIRIRDQQYLSAVALRWS